jgi:F-type H+-transporting ATPase subunit delta
LAFEGWTQQLGAVQSALSKDAGLQVALADAGRSTQDKLALLVQALPGGLDDNVRKFLGMLLEAGQLEQLDAILAEFDRMVTREPERQFAQVTSAVELTSAEKGALQSKLASMYGADLEFQYEVDPSVLGGIYLRVGDRVIDGTVAGKLASLRDRLSA